MLKRFCIFSLCLILLAASMGPVVQALSPTSFAPPIDQTAADASSNFAMDDVAPGAWYYRQVRHGFVHGYFHGSYGNFYPTRPLSRGEFVTMLGRLHVALGGALHPAQGNPFFLDLAPGASYRPYFLWAYAQGIVRPDTQRRVRPDAVLSRAELAVMLVRYMDAFDLHSHFEGGAEDRGAFEDQGLMANWSHGAIHTLRDYGLMLGSRGLRNEPGVYYFRPQDESNRREGAVVFYRFFTQLEASLAKQSSG